MPAVNVFSRSVILAAFASLLFLLGALPAAAAPQVTFDVKVDPKDIDAGKTMDIPLYLVENRAATDKSNFEGRALRYVRGNLRTTQSTFVSFTPIDEFTKVRKVSFYEDHHELYFELDSVDPSDFTPGSGGVPVTLDNSGIIGRTEIFLGMLRILIGPEIPRDDGIGDEDPPIIFSLDLDFEPPYGYSGYIMKHLTNGGHIGGGPVATNAIIIYGPDPNATPCELLQIFPKKGDLCEFRLTAAIKDEQPNKLLCTVGLRGVPKGPLEPVAVDLSFETGNQKYGIFESFNEISATSSTKGRASFSVKEVAKGKFVRCSIKGLEKDLYAPGVKVKKKKGNK